MNVKIRQELFAANTLSPQVDLFVNSYEKVAIGGCWEASISARGGLPALLDLINMLRYPVEIYNDYVDLVWWGYLFAAEVRFGRRSLNVSLGEMFNKIAVIFAQNSWGLGATSSTQKTAWAQNQDSVDRYGTKQKLISGSDSILAAAEALRDTTLEQSKFPLLAHRTGQSEGGSYSALLTCQGWFRSLDWQYYETAAGVEEYVKDGNGTQNLGLAGSSKVAQSFQLTSTYGWSATQLAVKARKFAAPADNLVMALYTNSGGIPGTLLGSVTVPASELTDYYDWHTKELATSVPLSPGTIYHLQVSRSGADDATNYYAVDVDEGLGYAGGSFLYYNGSWLSRSPNADMNFQVQGVEETTSQITRMVDIAAQFVQAIIIETPSGVYTNPYRDGRNTTLSYVRDLLAIGGPGSIRYICEVKPNMDLRVYPEPQVVDLVVDQDDNWISNNNQKVVKSTCPVAHWYQHQDMPPLRGVHLLLDPGRYFIERATYYPDKDQLETEPRGTSGAFDIVEFS